MKGGEVQRHIAPQFTRDPLAHRAQLSIGVVLGRDQQRRDLGPAVGLVHQVLQRVEHGREVRTGEPEVELLGERLQIDVGGVHFRVELAPRFGVDVARRHGHGLEAVRVARVRRVERVLGKDHRVVVGERHARAAGRQCGLRQSRRDSPGPSAGPFRWTWRCPSSGRTCRPGCSRRCRRKTRPSPDGSG